jgi:hypothetical protein
MREFRLGQFAVAAYGGRGRNFSKFLKNGPVGGAAAFALCFLHLFLFFLLRKGIKKGFGDGVKGGLLKAGLRVDQFSKCRFFAAGVKVFGIILCWRLGTRWIFLAGIHCCRRAAAVTH